MSDHRPRQAIPILHFCFVFRLYSACPVLYLLHHSPCHSFNYPGPQFAREHYPQHPVLLWVLPTTYIVVQVICVIYGLLGLNIMPLNQMSIILKDSWALQQLTFSSLQSVKELCYEHWQNTQQHLVGLTGRIYNYECFGGACMAGQNMLTESWLTNAWSSWRLVEVT